MRLVIFTNEKRDLICKTPLSEDAVKKKARELAECGFSIMDERGKHWLWDQCYDVLVETKTFNLIAVAPIRDNTTADVAESSMSKRRGDNYIGNRDDEEDLVHKGEVQRPVRDDVPLAAPSSRRYKALRGAGRGESRATKAGPPAWTDLHTPVDEEEEI